MKCPNCGGENGDGAEFCIYCGEMLPKAPVSGRSADDRKTSGIDGIELYPEPEEPKTQPSAPAPKPSAPVKTEMDIPGYSSDNKNSNSSGAAAYINQKSTSVSAASTGTGSTVTSRTGSAAPTTAGRTVSSGTGTPAVTVAKEAKPDQSILPESARTTGKEKLPEGAARPVTTTTTVSQPPARNYYKAVKRMKQARFMAFAATAAHAVLIYKTSGFSYLFRLSSQPMNKLPRLLPLLAFALAWLLLGLRSKGKIRKAGTITIPVVVYMISLILNIYNNQVLKSGMLPEVIFRTNIMPIVGCIFAISSVTAKEPRSRIAAGGMTAGYWAFSAVCVILSMISGLAGAGVSFPNIITYLPTILGYLFFVFYGLMATA